jgi:hypothetical protein
MQTDRYLELGPRGVLRWRRCAQCGGTLADDSSRRRGFDAACAVWAHAHPTEARHVRAVRIASDRESLAPVSPFG